MTTSTSTQYELDIKDTAGIVGLLTNAIEDPDFHSFGVYIGKNYPMGQVGGVPYFNVTIELKHRTNDNKTAAGTSSSSPA